ncbi:MAG: hypothetical protein AAF394_19280, partial [Planctomycetota bacterium]
TGTALAPGDSLVPGASGRAVRYNDAAPAVAGNFACMGRSLATVASGTANDTLFRMFADFRF